MSENRIVVEWKGNMAFEATPPSGKKFMMDTYPEEGETTLGPTPFETFVCAAAACSGIDVMIIMNKKRQKVTRYWVEVDGERTEEGVYPRPYKWLKFIHHVEGEDIDPKAFETAIKLSDEKYCSVIATLRAAPTVESVGEIH